VSEFTWDGVIDRLEGLYRELRSPRFPPPQESPTSS
jgi:hypothetical protein